MIKTRQHILLSALSMLICFCNTAKQQFDVNIKHTEESSKQVSHNKRMRKTDKSSSVTTLADASQDAKSPKAKKRNRTFMDFEYDELVRAKDVQHAKGNMSVTIKYVEQILKLCTDITLLSEHLLELADLLFIDNQFNKASIVYTQYCSLYPGSAKQEYALYRSIISTFACILSIDRDQTKTEETLALTELFLKQDHFTQYKDEVAHIQTKCYEHLAASECNICTFYITRNKLPAAEKRLKKIRSYWLPKLPTLEPTIIALEAQISDERERILLLNTPKTQLAHNKKTKHMANRF